MNKIISYLGFAIKSNNYIAGQMAIKQSRKQIFLIMLSKDATENLINLANNVANRQKCEIIQCKQSLHELSHLEHIKILAITDENIAKAIINNKEIIKIG